MGKQLCCTPLPQGVLSDELRRNGEREKWGRQIEGFKYPNLFWDMPCPIPTCAPATPPSPPCRTSARGWPAARETAGGGCCQQKGKDFMRYFWRVYQKTPGTLPTETNAGEFPWVVAIFDKTQKDPNDVEGRRLKFVGAGAFLDRDIVATVAHNMLAYQCEHWHEMFSIDSSLIHFSPTSRSLGASWRLGPETQVRE